MKRVSCFVRQLEAAMREDGTVHWDYSYAFAHGIGVYAVIVSTNQISDFSRPVPAACDVSYD